jgi:hypothetical protein
VACPGVSFSEGRPTSKKTGSPRKWAPVSSIARRQGMQQRIRRQYRKSKGAPAFNRNPFIEAVNITIITTSVYINVFAIIKRDIP